MSAGPERGAAFPVAHAGRAEKPAHHRANRIDRATRPCLGAAEEGAGRRRRPRGGSPTCRLPRDAGIALEQPGGDEGRLGREDVGNEGLAAGPAARGAVEGGAASPGPLEKGALVPLYSAIDSSYRRDEAF